MRHGNANVVSLHPIDAFCTLWMAATHPPQKHRRKAKAEPRRTRGGALCRVKRQQAPQQAQRALVRLGEVLHERWAR